MTFSFPQVVVSVEHFVTFAGHAVFLLLTRPNAHNTNFPYHVRTTQIGILEAMDGNMSGRNHSNSNGNANTNTNGTTSLGNNTLDAFSHGGAYGVTEHNTAMDIFTVDSVGSRRQFTPNVPPPYSAAAAAAVSNNHVSSSPSVQNWAENSTRKNSASMAVNGVAAAPARMENGNGTRIYDPNEGVDDEDDYDEYEGHL